MTDSTTPGASPVSEQKLQSAFQEYVKGKTCYGKRVASEMTILNTASFAAYNCQTVEPGGEETVRVDRESRASAHLSSPHPVRSEPSLRLALLLGLLILTLMLGVCCFGPLKIISLSISTYRPPGPQVVHRGREPYQWAAPSPSQWAAPHIRAEDRYISGPTQPVISVAIPGSESDRPDR